MTSVNCYCSTSTHTCLKRIPSLDVMTAIIMNQWHECQTYRITFTGLICHNISLSCPIHKHRTAYGI